MTHAFVPSLRHDDYCAHCSSPRSDRAHDILHTARANLSLKLAALLGCTVDELRASMRELVGAPVLDAAPDRQRAAAPHGRRETMQLHLAQGRQCMHRIGDDNQCERLHGHAGAHAFIGHLWTGDSRHTAPRCVAIDTLRARNMSSQLVTFRCVLDADHEGDAHELDNGEVFR